MKFLQDPHTYDQRFLMISILFSALMFMMCRSENPISVPLKRMDVEMIRNLDPGFYYDLIDPSSVDTLLPPSLLKIEKTWVNDYDPNFYGYIENLSWKDSLDLFDLSMIYATVESSKFEENHPDVMVPVLVHRLSALFTGDTLWRWEDYRKFLSISPHVSEKKYDQLLFYRLVPASLTTQLKTYTHHYYSVDDGVLNALVIRQCRQLRAGLLQNITIPPHWLNSNQQSLLHYSQMDNSVAIDSLFYEFTQFGKEEIRNKESTIVMTLFTYGREASYRTLEIVLDSNVFLAYHPFAREKLLQHLAHRVSLDFTKDEKARILKYLVNKKVHSTVLKNYVFDIAFIIMRMTGEDFDQAMIRLGYTRDKDGRRMIPMDTKEK